MLVGAIIALIIIIAIFESGVTKKYQNFERQKNEIPVELQIKRIEKQKKLKPPLPNNKETKTIKIIKNDTIKEDTTSIDIEIVETKITNNLPELNKTVKDSDIILLYAENEPKFPGGIDSLYSFLNSKIKYPEYALNREIQGRVYVRFVVRKTGKITNISIIRSIDPLLDKEALRVIKLLPAWKPATHKGKQVSIWKTIPVNFIIEFLN